MVKYKSVSNRTIHFDIAGFPGPVLPVGSLSCSFKNTSPIINRSRHINTRFLNRFLLYKISVLNNGACSSRPRVGFGEPSFFLFSCSCTYLVEGLCQSNEEEDFNQYVYKIGYLCVFSIVLQNIFLSIFKKKKKFQTIWVTEPFSPRLTNIQSPSTPMSCLSRQLICCVALVTNLKTKPFESLVE